MKIYIWRDALDGNMFSFGVQHKHGYTAWGNCFIDGLRECFGEDIHGRALLAKVGEAVAVEITANESSKQKAGE